MRKWVIFMLIKVKVEKSVSETRKSETLTFEISIWVKKKCVLELWEINKSLITFKICAKENSQSWSESEMKNKSLKYANSAKLCCFQTYFADSTIGWLSLKPVGGLFKSLKKVLFRVLLFVFFYVKIFTRTIQMNHGLVNVMKHDHKRGLRETTNLSRYIKLAQRSPFVTLLDADISSCPESWDCTLTYNFKPPPIYRKQS